MVSTTEARVARPDLAALPLDVQLLVEVAETQGWVARVTTEDDEPSFEAGEVVGLPPDWRERDIAFAAGILDEEDEPDQSNWEWIPEYLTDPAAWGALMEREGIACGPHPLDTPVKNWMALYDGLVPACNAATPGRAVCFAVLAKHGRDTSRYTEGEAR